MKIKQLYHLHIREKTSHLSRIPIGRRPHRIPTDFLRFDRVSSQKSYLLFELEVKRMVKWEEGGVEIGKKAEREEKGKKALTNGLKMRIIINCSA